MYIQYVHIVLVLVRCIIPMFVLYYLRLNIISCWCTNLTSRVFIVYGLLFYHIVRVLRFLSQARVKPKPNSLAVSSPIRTLPPTLRLLFPVTL